MIRAPILGMTAGAYTLPEDTSAYLCRVLRMRSGDRFVAFDPESRLEADAVIDDASKARARITIGPLRTAAVVAGVPVVLVYALAKGDKVDAVVRDATELGATDVLLAPTARSVVRLDEGKASTKEERWRRIAEQAARQSGRADPPRIAIAAGWRTALDRAADLTSTRFVLDPRASEALGPRLAQAVAGGASCAFAVGPEGGLAHEEVADAVEAGFAPVSLGPFVLRTETVAAAVLGAVRILQG